MDTRTEFEQLLASLCDGPAETNRSDRLCVLLREHPEWQIEYLDHLQLHALLRWRAGSIEAAEPATPSAEPSETRSRTAARSGKWRAWRLPVAIAFTLAIATSVVFLAAPEAQAGPEVIGQLVDWNLDISQANTPEARLAIFDTRNNDLKTLVGHARLPVEDRELADTLLETGSWLTRNNDPVAEAERFADIADKLLARLDSAATAPDERQAVRLADTYHRLAQIGVSGNIERGVAIGAFDQPGKLRLDKVIAGNTKRAQKLEDLLARPPESSHKAIHKALKGHSRKPHTP